MFEYEHCPVLDGEYCPFCKIEGVDEIKVFAWELNLDSVPVYERDIKNRYSKDNLFPMGGMNEKDDVSSIIVGSSFEQRYSFQDNEDKKYGYFCSVGHFWEDSSAKQWKKPKKDEGNDSGGGSSGSGEGPIQLPDVNKSNNHDPVGTSPRPCKPAPSSPTL